MIELSLIKLLLSKEQYIDALAHGINITDFPKELQVFYSCLSNYFNTNDDVNKLSVSDLSNLVFATSNKDKDFNESILVQLDKLDCSEQTSKTLLASLLRKKQLKELSLKAYEAYEGKLELEEVMALFQKWGQQGLSTEDSGPDSLAFVDDSLTELVHDAIAQPGLRWRLKTLNRMLGSLRIGDFGFIFARPETGKTTFLASEVSFMATQLKENDGPIIWINNEEGGKKVRLRMYQASLGVDLSALLSNPEEYEKQFRAATHDKLKLVDKAGISKNEIERLCRTHLPSLLIFDQIDKITGFTNDREDLRLGAIYQWARELAKTYCPVIGVCQADGTGEGVKWLTMGHVANAKTAKQAEADWIVGIGAIHDTGYETIRFLHASKNKLMGDPDSDPSLRHGKMEVLIKPNIARYEDLY